jgi:phospholipid/cholesterol/gamma-HCH transport system permease protein
MTEGDASPPEPATPPGPVTSAAPAPGVADVASPPRAQRLVDPDGRARIVVSGEWVLRALLPHGAVLYRRLAGYAREANVRWDLQGVHTLDAAGALLLWRSWGRRRPQLVLRPEHEAAFADLSPVAAPPPPRPVRDPLAPLLGIGRNALALASHVQEIVLLSGHLALDCLQLVRHPQRIPWREISANVYRTGTQALPIIALVGFLVGIVLSYLSARQLASYGANIYIINLLGIGIVRELGPMLAAILVAGRSGSSMTAQLGVMRVTEELDALAVMGISRTLRLVLPKVLALAIAMPLLVLWCNFIALFGGMLAAYQELGVTYRQFLRGLPATLPVANLWLGMGKGVLFGILIAVIACHYGLRIKPNTESLAAGTTDAVVASITTVILVDAAIAILFSSVGLK